MSVLIAIGLCLLSGLTDIKIMEVQILEIFMALSVLLMAMLPKARMVIQGSSILINILPHFFWILFFLFVGSILSLRLQFYPPPDVSMLKQPPFASFVRLAEVAIAMSTMFVVGLAVRNDPETFKRLLAAYVWCALVGCFWSFFCFVAHFAGLTLPGVTTYGDTVRMCGFFVEGGPFGVYLVGALLVHVIRGLYLHYIPRRALYVQTGVLLLGLVGAQSKAAIFVIGVLGMIYLLKAKRVRLILPLALLMIPVGLSSNIVRGVAGYYDNYQNFERAAAERPEDGALVLGRLAGAVLLPRIVEAHPLLGVGIGNYSLVRNDPSILRGLPRVEVWDLHGLGLFGYLAELGIPLSLYVFWLYAYPLRKAWRGRIWIVLLCAYPLLGALFGVQLNFAYPWIMSGLGLAAVGIDRNVVAQKLAALAAERERSRLWHDSSQPNRVAG